jgi:hypothetical protein
MRKTDPTNANALREQGASANQNTHNVCILADLIDSINDRVSIGETVTASDYPADQRPHYHAAIALLRDKIPLRVRWRTKTESALGDWKLRQRCYALPTELVTHPKGGAV